MADPNQLSQTAVDDPYKFLGITLNPDDTLTRPTIVPLSPPTGEEQPSQNVFSKDITFNPTLKTWFRIFRPATHNPGKLPIIIYFHGGGFILFSAASAPFDQSCATIARDLPAILISVEYRLAPENRLPSAYEDAVEAIHWVKNQAIDGNGEPWLREFGDFSRCFLMGSSSGGNIVLQAALRVCDLDLKPLRVAGLIMNQPYLGGKERTGSELRLVNDRIVPLSANDLMWELALPKGVDREHEFCDLVKWAERELVLPRCLVRGYGQDPLVDRQRELVKVLERRGVEVVSRFDEEGHHAVEFFDPHKARALLIDIRDFIASTRPSR